MRQPLSLPPKCIGLEYFQLFSQQGRRFIIVGSDESFTFSKMLKIHTNEEGELILTEDTTIYSRGQITGTIDQLLAAHWTKVLDFVALLGFVKFIEGHYIVVMADRRKVGIIGPHEVHEALGTQLEPLWDNVQKKKKGAFLGVGGFAKEDEERYRDLFSSFDMSHGFYFSYTYDMTNTVQSHVAHHMKQNDERLPYRDMYAWNWYLLDPLLKQLTPKEARYWVVPVIHGYFGQSTSSLFGLHIELVLVGRRSRLFAGTRFLKRGISDAGDVANHAETEQIVYDSTTCVQGRCTGFFSSHAQVRGSVPVSWIQIAEKMPRPKPAIRLNRFDPFFTSSHLHFKTLVEQYGSPVVCLDLLKQNEKHPREMLLSGAFVQLVNYLSDHLPPTVKVEYHPFDFRAASKTKAEKVINDATAIAEMVVAKTGFFCTRHASDGAPRLQGGIIRMNCVDCLDRTNLGAFFLGRHVLGLQLHAMGLLAHPSNALDYSVLMDELLRLYIEQGDKIAIGYGGSRTVSAGLLHRGVSWDMVTSIRRFYNNNFVDAEKQSQINLFLGNYHPCVAAYSLRRATIPPRWIYSTNMKNHLQKLGGKEEPVQSTALSIYKFWTRSAPKEKLALPAPGDFTEEARGVDLWELENDFYLHCDRPSPDVPDAFEMFSGAISNYDAAMGSLYGPASRGSVTSIELPEERVEKKVFTPPVVYCKDVEYFESDDDDSATHNFGVDLHIENTRMRMGEDPYKELVTRWESVFTPTPLPGPCDAWGVHIAPSTRAPGMGLGGGEGEGPTDWWHGLRERSSVQDSTTYSNYCSMNIQNDPPNAVFYHEYIKSLLSNNYQSTMEANYAQSLSCCEPEPAMKDLERYARSSAASCCDTGANEYNYFDLQDEVVTLPSSAVLRFAPFFYDELPARNISMLVAEFIKVMQEEIPTQDRIRHIDAKQNRAVMHTQHIPQIMCGGIYRRCFLGFEAASFVVKHAHAFGLRIPTRKRAVQFLGVLHEFHVCHHVIHAWPVMDGLYLYRFFDHERPRILNTHGTNDNYEVVHPGRLSERLLNTIYKHYTDWLAITNQYISGGWADIPLMKSPSFQAFQNSTSLLQNVDLKMCDDNEEKMACFINIFNILYVHGVLTVGMLPDVNIHVFMNTTCYIVGGVAFSLSDIKNGILRCNRLQPGFLFPQFKKKDPRLTLSLTKFDPRVMFSLFDLYSLREGGGKVSSGLAVGAAEKELYGLQWFPGYVQTHRALTERHPDEDERGSPSQFRSIPFASNLARDYHQGTPPTPAALSTSYQSGSSDHAVMGDDDDLSVRAMSMRSFPMSNSGSPLAPSEVIRSRSKSGFEGLASLPVATCSQHIEQQLSMRASKYCMSYVLVDKIRREIILPDSMFKFQDDFGGSKQSVLEAVLTWVPYRQRQQLEQAEKDERFELLYNRERRREKDQD